MFPEELGQNPDTAAEEKEATIRSLEAALDPAFDQESAYDDPPPGSTS